jgi:hypothetical protein
MPDEHLITKKSLVHKLSRKQVMSNPNPKLVMMRFDPRGGWAKPSDEQVEAPQTEPAPNLPEAKATPEAAMPANPKPVQPTPLPTRFSSESLNELGDSIMAVFNSLKINDPRLQVWEQVNTAIRQMSEKLSEVQSLENRLVSVRQEIEDLRGQTSNLVNTAYQNEVDVNATSKLRVQVAEALNMKITKVLQG